MPAPEDNPRASSITKADRVSRRKHYREQAQRDAERQALQRERSLSCLSPPHVEAVQGGDRVPHPTCGGLAACGPCGCLCECHDAEVGS